MFDKWKTRRARHEDGSRRPLSVVVMLASPGDAARLRDIFSSTAWEFQVARELDEAAAVVRASPAVVAIFDRDFPGADWRTAICRLANAHCRVILASFVADDYLWEEVIHYGGYDVLTKPFRTDEVLHMVQFASAELTKSLPCVPRTK